MPSGYDREPGEYEPDIGGWGRFAVFCIIVIVLMIGLGPLVYGIAFHQAV